MILSIGNKARLNLPRFGVKDKKCEDISDYFLNVFDGTQRPCIRRSSDPQLEDTQPKRVLRQTIQFSLKTTHPKQGAVQNILQVLGLDQKKMIDQLIAKLVSIGCQHSRPDRRNRAQRRVIKRFMCMVPVIMLKKCTRVTKIVCITKENMVNGVDSRDSNLSRI